MITKISLALALVLTAAPVLADDLTEMKNVGACLAFAYIHHDLDGKKDIPSNIMPGLNALKDEYMFRAAAAHWSVEDAQKYVVQQLFDQNKIKADKGIEALQAEYSVLCTNIAKALQTGE